MLDEAERLAARFAEMLKIGERALATQTLEYRQVLVDAMDERFKGSATDRLVNDCLDAGEADFVRGMVRSDDLMQLCPATLQRLEESGHVTARQFEAENNRRRQLVAGLGENPSPEEALAFLDPKDLPLHVGPKLWYFRALALQALRRHDEALEALEMCARLAPDGSAEALLKAKALAGLSRWREVIDVLGGYAKELAADPSAQAILAASFAMVGEPDRAIPFCEAALAQHEEPVVRRFLEALLRGRRARLQRDSAFAELRKVWNERIRALPPAEIIAGFPVEINGGNLHFVRRLIRESNLDDELLPLVVAMDYLETGDRSPLEKLSAEIRPIAEEIVAELQKKLPEVPERSTHKAHA
jgi:tetratricopeptide (TPR) repeat protein